MMDARLDRAAQPEPVRGRFAPSPTGALHLGNARTALLAWLQVRALGGCLVMRIEDLDQARTVAGGAEALLEQLRWLGLDWDEGPDVGGPCGPYRQSERGSMYEKAIAKLAALGRAFECTCSRSEIAAAASAPHGAADDGPRYPGTCRTVSPEAARKPAALRKPALRFRVEPGATPFVDGIHGTVSIDTSATVGDFVIRRADGVHAYQLAVAIDDAAMGITHVLRGDDLLASTPRQIELLRALGLRPPRYFHVPLLLGVDGQRLCKRKGELTLPWLRQRGVRPQRVVAELARSLGLTEASEVEPRELLANFDLSHIARQATGLDLARLVAY